VTALLGDGGVTSSDGSLDVEVAGVSGEVFAVTGELPPTPNGVDTGTGASAAGLLPSGMAVLLGLAVVALAATIVARRHG
jgi:hypothetical protein